MPEKIDPTEAWLARQGKPDAAPALIAASQNNPDKVAQGLTLAEQVGAAPTMDAGLNLLRQRAAQVASNTKTLQAAPDTEAWLADHQNASVSHDDVPTLAWWETGLKAIAPILPPPLRQARLLGTAAVGLALQARDPVQRYVTGGVVDDARAVPANLSAGQDDLGFYELASRVAFTGGTPEDRALLDRQDAYRQANPTASPGPLSIAARQAPQLGQLAVRGAPLAGAGAIAGAGVGSMGFGVGALPGATIGVGAGYKAFAITQSVTQNTGPAYVEFRSLRDEKGQKIDDGVARVAAIASGALSAGLDVFGLDKLVDATGLKLLSKPMIAQLLQRPTVREALGKIAARYGTAVATEGWTEGAQQAIQILSREAAKAGDGDKFAPTSMADATGEIVDNALAGAGAAAVLGGLGSVPRATVEIGRAQQAQQAAKLFEAIDENAKGSKLKGRMPTKYAEAVTAITANGPVPDVYVDADKLQELFQSKGITPAEGLEQMGLPANALADALNTGADLKVPMGTWADKIAGTPLAAEISQHAKFHADGMTSAQAKEFEANEPELVAAMKEAAASAAQATGHEGEQFKAFREGLTADLQEAGSFSPAQAATQADLVASAYRVMAARSGKPLDEFLAAYPAPLIQGVQGTRARAAVASVSVAPIIAAEGGAQASYLAALAKRESGGDPNARAGSSTATGLYQFTDRTWVDTLKRGGTDEQKALAKSITFDKAGRAILDTEEKRQFMGSRTDPAAATRAAVLLTATNTEALTKTLGRAPTTAETYVAHFLGAGGAGKLLSGDDSADAASLLPAEARANPSIFNVGRGDKRRPATVAEVKANLAKGFDPGETVLAQAAAAVGEEPDAFASWFGDSKVVTPEGAPLTVYHGTNQPIESFALDRGGKSTGAHGGAELGFFFTSNPANASDYAEYAGKVQVADAVAHEALVERLRTASQQAERVAQRTGNWSAAEAAMQAWEDAESGAINAEDITGQNIVPAYLSLRNPKEIDLTGGGIPLDLTEQVAAAKAAGHDGVILRNVNDPPPHTADHFVVFDPTQIKSIFNRGTFDPNDPRILYQNIKAAEQPTGRQLASLAGRSKEQSLRGVIDGAGKFHFWDAADAIHKDGADAIGVPYWPGGTDNRLWVHLDHGDPVLSVPEGFDPASLGPYLNDPNIYFDAGSAGILSGPEYRDALGLGRTLYQSQGPFYSGLAKAIADSSTTRAGAEQWAATLAKTPGVKKEELEWTGINDWLALHDGPISRTDLLAFIENNGVAVEEVLLGDDGRASTIDSHRIAAEDDRFVVYDQYGDEVGDFDTEVEAADHIEALADAESQMGAVQFKDWKLPGADDSYRELLLTLPKERNERLARDFTASHWDQPSVIAHTRFTERTDAEGKRVLFVEEVQSDWHQKGRDEGYAAFSDEQRAASIDAYNAAKARAYAASEALLATAYDLDLTPEFTTYGARVDGLGFDDKVRVVNNALINAYATQPLHERVRQRINETLDEYNRSRLVRTEAENDFRRMSSGIPDAPFKTSWPALVMKRLIRWAVDNGYERVAWTTGAQQSARYNLSSATGPIHAWADGEVFVLTMDAQAVNTLTENGMGVSTDNYRSGRNSVQMTAEQMKAAFGADVAGRLTELATQDQGGTLRDADLNVGGEGMRAFYDRNLINITNDIIKKHGAKVGRGDVVVNEDRARQISGFGRGDPEAIAIAREDGHVTEQPGFTITPELAAAAKGGFTLFQTLAQDDTDPTAGPKRGSIELPNAGLGEGRRATINLFQARDLSTFAHESGHLFLEILASLAAQDSATDQQKADMDALRAWWNIPHDAPITVREHEMFAEAFEQYLYEGRAPAARLQTVFDSFRSWLVYIYRALRGVRADVSDDVRGVMDRLLATDDEIASARAGQRMDPIATPEELGMNGAQASQYEAMRARALAVAHAEADARVLSAVNRQRQAWWRQVREGVRDEVDQDVAARPIYRAFEWLTQGTWLYGEPPQDLAGMKLGRAAIVADYGADKLKALPMGASFTRVYADDGVHPDIAAEQFGYATGKELIDALTGMERRRAVTDRETDAAMVERYGDPALDGNMPLVAMEASHNVAQQRVIELELEALQGRPVAFGLRQAAERAVLGMTVADAGKPDRHLVAERRAAAAAQEAFKAGDLQEAARQKFRQLAAFHAWQATRRAADELDKAEALFSRVTTGKTDKVAKARNMDLVMAARAVLAAHGVGKADGTPDAYLALVAEYDPITHADVAPSVAAAMVNPVPVANMLVSDFNGMRDAVDALWRMSKSTQSILIEGRRMDAERARDELVAQLHTKGAKKPIGQAKAMTDGERTLHGLSGIRSAMRRVEHWARAIDGGVVGPWTRYVFRPISEAATAYRAARDPVVRALRDILTRHAHLMTPAKIAAPELGYTFNGKAELLHAILHTGNASNKAKLLLGGRPGSPWGVRREDGSVDDARWAGMIARMAGDGTLVAEDYQMAQEIWDLMETTKPGAQKTHRAVYGYYFAEITADPVQTPFGVFKGGYVPAVADSDLVADAAEKQAAEAVTAATGAGGGNGASFMFPSPGRGFTKGRKEGYTKPLALDLRLLASHLDKVLLFTHMAQPVREVARLLSSSVVKEQLAAVDPTASLDMIQPWLLRAATQTVEARAPGKGWSIPNKIAKAIRTRSGANAMVLNVVNAAQQLTGLTVAMTHVGPRRVLAGVFGLMAHPYKYGQAVAEASPFMADRMQSSFGDVRADLERLILNPNPFERTQQFLQRHGQFLQHVMQNTVDVVVWQATYDKEYAATGEHGESVRRADAAVRQTQGSINPEDVSRFETGSPFQRLFTQFVGYFNMQANLLATEALDAPQGRSVTGAARRLLWVYVVAFAVPALISEAMTRASRGQFYDDEDDGYLDEFMDWFFSAQVRGATALLPVGGAVLQAGLNSFNDKPYDDKLNTGAGFSALEKSIAAPHELWKMATGDGRAAPAIKDTFTALGLISGLPFGALARPVGYAASVHIDGDVTPSSGADYARGLVTGAPSDESRN